MHIQRLLTQLYYIFQYRKANDGKIPRPKSICPFRLTAVYHFNIFRQISEISGKNGRSDNWFHNSFILGSVFRNSECLSIQVIRSFYIRSSDGIHEAIHPFSDVSCQEAARKNGYETHPAQPPLYISCHPSQSFPQTIDAVTNLFSFQNLHDHRFSFRTDQFTPGGRIRRQSTNKS